MKQEHTSPPPRTARFWPNFLLALLVFGVPLSVKVALNKVSAQDSSQSQLNCTAAVAANDAWVLTDKDDYAPAETAYITGAGFCPGESIVLQVLHVHQEEINGQIIETVEDPPAEDTEGHHTWNALADDQGRLRDLDGTFVDQNGTPYTTWHVCEDDCVGETLELRATGQTSGLVAKTRFTDAAALSYSPASVSPSATAGGSASFIQTVTTASGSGTFTASPVFNGTGGNKIPDSWVSTSPTSLSFNTAAGADSESWTVFLSPPCGTPAATYTGTIKANPSIGGVGQGTGTDISLTVSSCGCVGAAGTITGSATVCANATGVAYTIAVVTGATTYNWTVPSGATVASGQGTTSITVNFGSSSGNVAVTPSNSCENTGAANSKSVTVNPLPSTSAISGDASVCANEAGVTYSVTLTSGSSYAWTVPSGATITAGTTGPNNNQITVTFGTTSGNVTVQETSAAGCVGSQKSLAVTVNPLPTTSAISGSTSVSAGQSAVHYSVTLNSGSSYAWAAPTGASITSGATGPNNNEIVVTFGCTGGNVTVTETSAAGCAGSQKSLAVTVQSATSLLYNGDQIVTTPNSITLKAQLSSTCSTCVSGQTIKFYLDMNPLTGITAPSPGYLLGTAITLGTGQASLPAISTTGWLEGIYTVTPTYAGQTVGSAACLASEDDATITVAQPGTSATGGGWYTLSGSGRVNFGFTVRKVPNSNPIVYKGQCVSINNGKWRLKGTLDTYVKTGSNGAASGVGNLYWWNPTLNGGLGDWVLSQSSVAYTISLYDNGSGGKNSGDKFGIVIQHTIVSPPEPGTLPNASPTQLKGGNLTLN